MTDVSTGTGSGFLLAFVLILAILGCAAVYAFERNKRYVRPYGSRESGSYFSPTSHHPRSLLLPYNALSPHYVRSRSYVYTEPAAAVNRFAASASAPQHSMAVGPFREDRSWRGITGTISRDKDRDSVQQTGRGGSAPTQQGYQSLEQSCSDE
jgi:hypothetical protein